MLKSIKNRLILLYTCSTGVILTAVLIFVLILTNKQILRSKLEAFQNNYLTLSQNLQINNEISYLWLSEMEMKNQLIIHIEDNGKPLLFQGAWKVPSNRNDMINKVKALAKKDNINTNIPPISLNGLKSRVYQFQGDNNDRYFGEVFLVPSDLGYRSLVLLQYISADNLANNKQSIIIILINLIGIIALYLVSRWVVGKALKPVEESRKRQNEFIAAASHELKSPLAVIRANASALTVEPEKSPYFTKGIDKECERMSTLIEDMLLLASADAKSWRIKKEQIDMDLLLIDIYDTYSPVCKEQGKELRLILPEDMLPNVEGDALRIRQIIAVLIDNAAFYSKNQDIIIVRAYLKKNHLWIEIEDHGPGIDQSKKKEIFERFYREDKSRKDKKHFGLGLSVAKELTELHGGNISVKDTQGGGATFALSLPVIINKSRT